MKDIQLNMTTIVVVLVVVFTIFVDLGSPASPKEFVIDKPMSEGFVAFIVNEKSFDTEGGDVQNECECNGTKELTHGDGHKTPCPCTGASDGCKCKHKPTQPLKEVKKKLIKPCRPASLHQGGVGGRGWLLRNK